MPRSLSERYDAITTWNVATWPRENHGSLRHCAVVACRMPKSEVHEWLHHWQDEADAASLYLALAGTLAELAGKGAEPWHKTGSGGFLRNVVYGFNDGLTANFGLVAGVIGADVAPHIVLVSGIAGMFADALSMGASGYLAAKSEQEVYDHEIAMEKEEIRIMPEVEEEELALVYQTKGIEAGIARKMAAEVMRDSQRALDEQVREELKIGEAHATPFKEGWLTGASAPRAAFSPGGACSGVGSICSPWGWASRGSATSSEMWSQRSSRPRSSTDDPARRRFSEPVYRSRTSAPTRPAAPARRLPPRSPPGSPSPARGPCRSPAPPLPRLRLRRVARRTRATSP